MKETAPNPGSIEALSQGCTCPIIDNHYGEGIILDEKVSHWIIKGCPLHNSITLLLNK